eukprot:5099261-Prymnesium_polylepis.1
MSSMLPNAEGETSAKRCGACVRSQRRPRNSGGTCHGGEPTPNDGRWPMMWPMADVVAKGGV